MITLKDIHKSYSIGNNQLHVLKGINLSIEEGEMVAIMGSSGSGKSTLLNILGILDYTDTGEYILDNVKIGEKLKENQASEYRNKFLGFVFQSFNLISFKNALDNVSLPLYYQKIKKSKRDELALEYLDKVGLKNWSHHMPNELSGGQKQRVAIARALITNPKVILADEPTGALDSKTTYDVIKFLQQINNEGKTIIIVTHEPEVARQCKRIVFLKDGFIENDTYVEQEALK